jgi:hypothetical protein
MDTNSRITLAAAAVTGARHLRAQRNGQDAVATRRGERATAIVACDGCGSGASSEVGARLGASLFARAVTDLVDRGAAVDDEATWSAARAAVARVLRELVAKSCDGALHDQLLFTVVAAAADVDGRAAVWVLGDGAFAFDDDVTVVGPFAENAPPYLAYDLVDEHAAPPRFAIAPPDWRAIVVATDGARDLAIALPRLGDGRFVDHPDALRRYLAVLARADEHVDWDARRIARRPASLQDDCAVAVLRRRSRS